MIRISEVHQGAPDDQRQGLESQAYDTLKKLGIPFERVDNDAVEAMADCVEISERLGAEIRKTVLLCNRQKTEYHMLIMSADKPFVTKDYSEAVGCARMSFASGDAMVELLGQPPGTASVMGLLNDGDGRVKLLIEESVANEDWFACNPGVNTSHIRFRTKDLVEKLLPAIGHGVTIIKL